MASSGSCNTGKYSTSSSGTIGLNLSWSIKSQSIENNTTTITWTLKSNGSMSTGYCVKAGPVTCTINGTKVVNTTSRFDMYGGGKYKKTGTLTITHTADGTKKFNASVTAALYSASVNVWTGTSSNHNVSFTLNTINRYALISSADNFTDEVGTDGYPTLVYTNPAGTSLTTGLKARITWNSGANYTDWVTLNDEGGTYTFTSSTLTAANISSMLSACTTSNTLPIQYDLQSTMGGNEYHDTKNATMTVVNADPMPQSLSYLDVNSTTTGKTGSSSIIVQSQSTLRIRTTPSTAKKGATIASYSLNINNNDYTPTISGGYVYVDFVNPSLSGTFLATMTTMDSRGNMAVATTNVIVQPWEPPTALFTLSRVNGFYTNTILYVDASMSSVSNTNSMTIQEQHRQAGSSTWSTATTVQNKTNTTIALDNSYAWELQVLVTDEYTTTTYGAAVGKGIPIMFIDKDKNSIGVNGYPDANNQIYVDGSIKATGPLTSEVRDISSQYTWTKTSGNWTINSLEAWRVGNIVQMRIVFQGNGSAVGSGSNGVVGLITSGPMPAVVTQLVGYGDARVISGSLNPASTQYAIRNTSTTEVKWTSASRVAVGATFITADPW